MLSTEALNIAENILPRKVLSLYVAPGHPQIRVYAALAAEIQRTADEKAKR